MLTLHYGHVAIISKTTVEINTRFLAIKPRLKPDDIWSIFVKDGNFFISCYTD